MANTAQRVFGDNVTRSLGRFRFRREPRAKVSEGHALGAHLT
jgi:hypothetical protein